MIKSYIISLTFFAGCALISFSWPALSEVSLKIAVAELPDVDKHPKEDLFVKLLSAIEKQPYISQIEILRMPFARSIVELGRAHVDAQLPIMYDPQDAQGATEYMEQFGVSLNELTYTDETLFRAHFVIVSREELGITPETVAQFDVVTDISHVAFFKNQFPGTHSMKASIARVQNGSLSGYLFEEHKVNQVIRELDFVDHRLNTWAFYDVRLMVRNDKRGIRVKNAIDKSIEALKASGEFQRIMQDLINEHGF